MQDKNVALIMLNKTKQKCFKRHFWQSHSITAVQIPSPDFKSRSVMSQNSTEMQDSYIASKQYRNVAVEVHNVKQLH